MIKHLRLFRIFIISLIISVIVVAIKYLLHDYNLEPIEQSSLHNSVSSGVFFVVGFILSATIADYKESEKIPADFASNIEGLVEDARSIHQSYPKFDLDGYETQLKTVLTSFNTDVRRKSHKSRDHIHALNPYYLQMEKAGVPANFIVKLKQQQSILLRSVFRVNYIQRISFIPSATILARSIVILLIVMLTLTNVDPFYGGLVIVGLITFILAYMLILIKVISTPFHAEGKTRDDVSLFLLTDVNRHIGSKENSEN